MIRVENLVYKYPGKKALDDVSFTIAPGTITALVGPNGAGKTTLLRCIAALDSPFSGNIRIAGIDVGENPRKVHRSLGYLSDFFGLYGHLTIMQCLVFAGKLHGLEGRSLFMKIQETAEILGLTPYFNQKASSLSRGWRQRLGIAQSIIHRPRLLLLDEPASGLDPESRAGLSSLMRRLRDEGMTLMVSSHVLAELEDYCTQMLVLRDGKIVEHCDAAPSRENNIIDISFIGDPAVLGALLAASAESARFTQSAQVMRVEFSGTEEQQHLLLKRLIEGGARISRFAVQEVRLQDVYMSLSEKAKR